MSEMVEPRRSAEVDPGLETPPAPLPRWWGWGDRDGNIGAGLERELHERLGIEMARHARTYAVALEDVDLPPSRLGDEARTDIAAAADGHLDSSRRQRVQHCAGKSYTDLLRMRGGFPAAAPDAVVRPGSEAEVAAVLAACERHAVAVVPFGGGTSVVGGVTPLSGAHGAVISLDMSRMAAVLSIDPVNEIARLQPGMRGPEAEAALGRRGFTLGHFPQSFEYATIGGFAATRSAGQASSGYGRFDEMVVGVRCVTPRGVIAVGTATPNAAGPSLREVVLGSEGILGVITEVSVRIRRRPAAQWYEGWSVDGFDTGVALLHRLVRAGIMPDVARISDAEETHMTFAMAGGAAAWLERLVKARGQREPCLLLIGWDGSPAEVTRRRATFLPLAREHGALRLGRRVGDTWRHHRFETPRLRDPLLDRHVLVETLETSTLWDRLHTLRADVLAALRADLTVEGCEPLIGAHVSHSYSQGASLYITVMARQEGDAIAQWQRAKAHVCDVLVASGATITHHHAVGTDHAPWLERIVGAEGVAALRALKQQFDPAGIMNPGKLIP